MGGGARTFRDQRVGNMAGGGIYDAASDSFKPYGSDSSFGKECYQCHMLVKDKYFIFTGYPPGGKSIEDFWD